MIFHQHLKRSPTSLSLISSHDFLRNNNDYKKRLNKNNKDVGKSKKDVTVKLLRDYKWNRLKKIIHLNNQRICKLTVASTGDSDVDVIVMLVAL